MYLRVQILFMKKSMYSLVLMLVLAACNNPAAHEVATEADTSGTSSSGTSLSFDPENGSLELPEGFKAVVVADKLGRVRHIDVDEKGRVYARLGSDVGGKGLV
ncbi:MAG TPA: hypothetical protein DDW81_15345, partial [Cryomorphaceae bacterium]|nr:hypothetical protein [Cryomorphaceae bacterium]